MHYQVASTLGDVLHVIHLQLPSDWLTINASRVHYISGSNSSLFDVDYTVFEFNTQLKFTTEEPQYCQPMKNTPNYWVTTFVELLYFIILDGAS